MIDFQRWEIWEADVPFEDKPGSKRRPVLFLSETGMLVLSLKMTSHEARYKKLNCDRFTGKKFGRLTATDIIGLQAVLRYMGIRE